MIPPAMMTLYVDVLKYKIRIKRWYTCEDGTELRIYFESIGFYPDNPYEFDQRIVSWTTQKQI